jgi:hypothetical protein
LLPHTARVWEHFTLGGRCWCPRASVWPPSYASSIRSSGRFWSMAWRSGDRLWWQGHGGGAAQAALHLWCTLINSFSLHVAWLAVSVPSLENQAGLVVLVSLLKCFWLCVKCCPVNVRVTSLISVTLHAFGQHRGSRTPQLSSTSVLPPMLLWHLTIPGCGACCAPLSNCLLLFRWPPSLIAACALICARRLPLPGQPPWPRTLLRKTFLPGGVGVDLARQSISTLSGAPLTCAPPRCRSCTLTLLWCSLSSVFSLANSHSATL